MPSWDTLLEVSGDFQRRWDYARPDGLPHAEGRELVKKEVQAMTDI